MQLNADCGQYSTHVLYHYCAPSQPLPAHAQRSTFVTRGAPEYVSQMEGTQHQNNDHFELILVVGGQSALSMYVCTFLYSTFEGEKGFPPIYSTKRYQPSFPPVLVW
jgi:hypothetical protein